VKKYIISLFSFLIAVNYCYLSVSASFMDNGNFAMGINNDFAMDDMLTHADYAINHSDGVFEDNMYTLNDLNQLSDSLFFGNSEAVTFGDSADMGIITAVDEQGDWSADFNNFYAGDFDNFDLVYAQADAFPESIELSSAEIFTDADIIVAADSLSAPDPLVMAGIQTEEVAKAETGVPEYYMPELEAAVNMQDMTQDILQNFEVEIASPDQMVNDALLSGEEDSGGGGGFSQDIDFGDIDSADGGGGGEGSDSEGDSEGGE